MSHCASHPLLRIHFTPTQPQNRSARARLIVFTAVMAIAGNLIPAQELSKRDRAPAAVRHTSPAAVRAQVEALLSGYEYSPTTADWRSLGHAAPAILAEIAGDNSMLPTRRARSLEGLASLPGARPALFKRLAYSEQEPLIVRMSAARGLGKLLPESSRVTTVRGLLKTADSRLRGVAAEVLAQSPAGCSSVRAQAEQESEAWRARFAGGCVAPASSGPEAAAGSTSHSISLAAQTSAAAATSSGQKYIIPLGSVQVYTNQLSSPIVVNIPANAVSFEFTGVAANPNARVVVYRIVDPSGVVLYNYASITNSLKVLPAPSGSFSVGLPNTPTIPLKPGPWTFYLLGASQTTADVNVVYKTSVASPAARTLNANLYFVGVPGMSAASAPTDPNFQQVLSTVRSIYSQVGVTLGNLTYFDVEGSDEVRFADVRESDLSSLFQLSESPQAPREAVNIFLVHSISFGAVLSGYVILGESAGIPGVPINGTTASGLVITMADFPNAPDQIGATLAHEMGHWLGLFHTTESNGLAFDPLPDTPECTRVPYDTNNDGIMEPQECINLDAPDLMFWTSIPSIPATLLTPDQGFVIQRNPLQNANFQPIEVAPPPITRVPEDFPTVQLAVDAAPAGGTVRVGQGRWCGALISHTVNLVGKGATIMGCPPGPAGTGPIGTLRKVGFYVANTAPGTSISGFVFDGSGFSFTNRDPLAYGVTGDAGVGIIVDSNIFLGGAFPLFVQGDSSQVTRNVFDGFTVLPNGFGGAAIFAYGLSPQYGGAGSFVENVIRDNTITSTVPPGNYSGLSWASGADVPLAGIVVTGENGAIVSGNKTSITANANGDAGVGVFASDFGGLTTPNLRIVNNDGKRSQYSVIVTPDQYGGTGNSVGLTLQGNFGLNLIDGVPFYVHDDEQTLQCDPFTGVCPAIPLE